MEFSKLGNEQKDRREHIKICSKQTHLAEANWVTEWWTNKQMNQQTNMSISTLGPLAYALRMGYAFSWKIYLLFLDNTFSMVFVERKLIVGESFVCFGVIGRLASTPQYKTEAILDM